MDWQNCTLKLDFKHGMKRLYCNAFRYLFDLLYYEIRKSFYNSSSLKAGGKAARQASTPRSNLPAAVVVVVADAGKRRACKGEKGNQIKLDVETYLQF